MRSHLGALWLVTALLSTTSYADGVTQEEVVRSYSGKTFSASDVLFFLERSHAYRITVFGTGVVEYYEQGESGQGMPRAKIPEENVLKLVNQFLSARFFDAADDYTRTDTVYVRRGRWSIGSSSIADLPEVRLGLKIGSFEKYVRFQPRDPRSLWDLADEIDRTVCLLPGYEVLPPCKLTKG